MERKIGEIFEHKGEWYQCVYNIHGNCDGCSFSHINSFEYGSVCCESYLVDIHGKCGKVIFKKLEKVGEPYIIGNKLIQRYKMYPTTYHINVYGWYYHNLDVKSWTIDIEIKQNKEDMEEKKIKLSQDDIDWLKKRIRWDALPGYIAHEEDYDRATEEIMNLFISSDTEHSSSEKIGKNLKPFDLEAAKAGKPVCTRDGRKARIICFDRIDTKPILALVRSTDGKGEDIFDYFVNGKRLAANVLESDLDLMMLPGKRSGWVNICRNLNTNKTELDTEDIYSTKEEALQNLSSMTYVTTVKIEWEE